VGIRDVTHRRVIDRLYLCLSVVPIFKSGRANPSGIYSCLFNLPIC